jgi:hypothetical protein
MDPRIEYAFMNLCCASESDLHLYVPPTVADTIVSRVVSHICDNIRNNRKPEVGAGFESVGTIDLNYFALISTIYNNIVIAVRRMTGINVRLKSIYSKCENNRVESEMMFELGNHAELSDETFSNTGIMTHRLHEDRGVSCTYTYRGRFNDMLTKIVGIETKMADDSIFDPAEYYIHMVAIVPGWFTSNNGNLSALDSKIGLSYKKIVPN